MELLELGEDKLVMISTTVSSITEFKKLIKRDKDRTKKTAIGEITFIYHWLNPKSPFFNKREKDKLSGCIRNSGLDATYDYTKDIDMLSAIVKYNEFLDDEVPSLSLYRSSLRALDTLKDYLDTISLVEPDDAKKLMDVLKGIGILSRALKEDYAKLKEELQATSGLRGQSRKGHREDVNQ